MSVDARLTALERRHNALDCEIMQQAQKASTDNLSIANLKREKLRIKDEITRLRNGNGGSHCN